VPTPQTTADAITAAWRAESTKLIAALTRLSRDVGAAEDLAQDALVAALEQWPDRGIPLNPGAWLMTTAKRRGIDQIRRAETLKRKTEEIEQALLAAEESGMPDLDERVDYIEDDVLRLMFLCCHPLLTPESRTALTLRLVGGLTTTEIARGFLVTDAAMGQRISRAKKTLTEAGAEFELPIGEDRARRLDDVMAVIYLVFNEGYAATSGQDWVRPTLCREAMRLGRILAELTPGESEVHGLVALMEIQASRLRARVGPSGEPVLLPDQDRGRWDRVLITRGLAALDRAENLGTALGPYALQAAIGACHARARSVEETDWSRIAALYEALAEIAPSPVIELNRAVAVSRAYGPAAGLELIEALLGVPALRGYHLLPSARGDLLEQLGRRDEAGAEFERAASLTRNEREQGLLLARAAACGRRLGS
jgi:RNA polymerase sigma factor (sigma-70 family)